MPDDEDSEKDDQEGTDEGDRADAGVNGFEHLVTELLDTGISGERCHVGDDRGGRRGGRRSLRHRRDRT